MTDIQNNNTASANQRDFTLYTTLSIFAVKAPKLINSIDEAIRAENMGELEDHAVKLIVYSNNAQLVGFTERVKNLIIAARENKIHTAKEHSTSIKACFEQMTQIAGSGV